MYVKTEIGGCLAYVEPLQSPVSYSVIPQWLCPLIPTSEMVEGPQNVHKWAKIQLNLLYTSLQSHSTAEVLPFGGLWEWKGERHQSYKNTAAVGN